MTFGFHDMAAVPIASGLRQARHIAGIAAAHAGAHGIDEAAMLRWRLVPDMLTLAHQFAILADGARGTLARLAGRPPADEADPSMAVFNRGEARTFHLRTSFAALDADLADAAAFVNGLSPADLEGPRDRPISVIWLDDVRVFPADRFLTAYVLPNFYFHLSIAYAILRARGVALGKPDYEGDPH